MASTLQDNWQGPFRESEGEQSPSPTRRSLIFVSQRSCYSFRSQPVFFTSSSSLQVAHTGRTEEAFYSKDSSTPFNLLAKRLSPLLSTIRRRLLCRLRSVTRYSKGRHTQNKKSIKSQNPRSPASLHPCYPATRFHHWTVHAATTCLENFE